MTEREKIIQQQKQLKALFSVWMKEKMNHEVVTFQKTDGKIVEHYPEWFGKNCGLCKIKRFLLWDKWFGKKYFTFF